MAKRGRRRGIYLVKLRNFCDFGDEALELIEVYDKLSGRLRAALVAER